MKTSLYTILCIVVRLGAIWLGLSTLLQLALAPQIVADLKLGDTAWLLVIGWDIGMVALAALLWIYPGVLARVAAGKSATQTFESPISAEALQYIAFSVVGLWIAIGGLLGLARDGLQMVYATHLQGESALEAAHLVWRDIIEVALQFAIGIALVLGSRGLVGALRAFRERGLPAHVPEDDVALRDDRTPPPAT